MPVLQFPNWNHQYKLETDASDRAIGGVLWVETDKDVFLPVAYKYRKLDNSEHHYPIHDKELVAIVHCVKK